MNKIICAILTSALIVNNVSVMPLQAGESDTPVEIGKNASIVSLGTEKVVIDYNDTIGYYLEQEIEQGINITILGKGLYELAMNPISKEYFLISGSHTDKIYVNEHETDQLIRIPVRQNRSGSFYNPTDVVYKTEGNLTIYGVWWGGILDDIGTSGNVGSSTTATSPNTQGKASVRPGWTADWVNSGWENRYINASIMRACGVGGNAAKWDLRGI